MIDVRTFCSEPGFRSAVLLTYSFDAVFFERVVLPDLRAGGTGTTVVVADRREVEQAIPRWQGHAHQVGRRYVLDLPAVPGSFHAKMIVRAGPRGGAVWCGTGNVTPSGWGANDELATSWRIGPDLPDAGAWVGSLIDQLAAWTESALARDALSRIRAEPWIQTAASISDRSSAPLWSAPGATLSDQIAERWRGRRFTSVCVTTGSTDASGAFLRWAHETFGVEEARVAVHADCASFDPALVERLPMQVDFVEPPGPKHLHAKSYWFDGPDGAAAIVGSANCSASAWLRPVTSGGNVEAIVAMDRPNREEWERILAAFRGSTRSAREHLRGSPREPDVSIAPPPYRLIGVEVHGETGRVLARLAPAPPAESRVSLSVDGEVLAATPRDGHPDSWDAPLPEGWGTARARFASVRIETSSGRFDTAPRWIDDAAELRASAQDHRVSVTLTRLSTAADVGEYRRIADDLQFAMDAILNDPAGFADPPPRRRSEPQSEPDVGDARRLDPSRVAVAFGTPAADLAALAHGAAGPSLSFGGVLDALFPAEGEDVDPDDDEAPSGEEGGSSASPSEGPDGLPLVLRPVPPEHLRRCVAKQMDEYFARLRTPAFASACTATQLVSAVTFPIALAALGSRSGWADAAQAQRWTVSAVTALLHGPVEGLADGGILRAVGERYRADGREDVYREAIGTGVLWTAAATVLAETTWSGVGGRIRRALLLRDVFRCEELTSAVNSQQLLVAAGRFRGGDAVATIRDELPRIDRLLDGLEVWIADRFDAAVKDTTIRRAAVEAGDPLWQPRVGWVFVTNDTHSSPDRKLHVEPWRPGQFSGRLGAIAVSPGFYLNVRVALAAAGPLAPDLP